jgi:tripartite-type tricarboxylate transporter receptor subunit TctC
MTNIASQFFRALFILIAMVLLAPVVMAQQAYPNKPVRIIVPYPPGGTADIIGRTIAEKLGVLWGQSVIVENRAGAGGTIGVDAVAKAAPDGYTMVLGVTGPLTIAPSINAQLAYDPLRDLVPITLVAAVPSLIAIHPSVPARDLKELIALAKSQPGKLTFASAGTGTSVHIAGELFKSMAGVDIIHVPYKGGAPALNDLLGGQVSMIIENMPQLLPQVRAGKIRALAVTSQQRSPTLADLPAVAEILPGYEATTWFGLLAPAKTPQEIVRKVQSDVAKIGMLPDVKERFTGLGADVIASTPEAFAKHLQSELVRFSKVIKDANIKAQ